MLSIRVTQAHIDAGIPGSDTGCPIALALLEATGKPWLVCGLWAHDGKGKRLMLSLDACDFQAAFDQFAEVRPFTLETAVVVPPRPYDGIAWEQVLDGPIVHG